MSIVVDEARQWIGTPWVHQARTRGLGCDCVGLVGGVAVALGAVHARWWEQEFDLLHGGYAQTPGRQMLRAACDKYMDRVAGAAQSGDVMLMRFGPEPQHLAIYARSDDGAETMIHAYSPAGRTVEHRINSAWKARIVAVYRLRGIAA